MDIPTWSYAFKGSANQFSQDHVIVNNKNAQILW